LSLNFELSRSQIFKLNGATVSVDEKIIEEVPIEKKEDKEASKDESDKKEDSDEAADESEEAADKTEESSEEEEV